MGNDFDYSEDEILDPSSLGRITPVEAILETDACEGSVVCTICDERLTDETIYDGSGNYFCEKCWDVLIKERFEEAMEKAIVDCKMNGDLPTYDPTKRWACTPEEYALGEKYSYTENAFRARLRHEYSNYEDLIRNLDKTCAYDQVTYYAIRSQIDELIEDAILEHDLIRTDFE